MIHYADYIHHLSVLKSLCVRIIRVAGTTSTGVGNGSDAAGSVGSHAPTPGPSALSQAPVVPVVVVAAGPVAAGPLVVAACGTASVPSAVVPAVAAGPIAAGPQVMAACATASVPGAVVPAAVPVVVPAANAHANTGGGGRPQEMCGNRADGCHNHKVLNCTYGLCGVCCAASKRDPRCDVTKHYNKNTHK